MGCQKEALTMEKDDQSSRCATDGRQCNMGSSDVHEKFKCVFAMRHDSFVHGEWDPWVYDQQDWTKEGRPKLYIFALSRLQITK